MANEVDKVCCGKQPLKFTGGIGWWKFYTCPRCGGLWKINRGAKHWHKVAC